MYEKKAGFKSNNKLLLKQQQVCNKHQSGYPENHSIATLFSKLYDDIKMAIKQIELAYNGCFTDYSKAFDTIDFFLWYKKCIHGLFILGF